MTQEHCLQPRRLCTAQRQGVGKGEVGKIPIGCSENGAPQLYNVLAHPPLQTSPLRGRTDLLDLALHLLISTDPSGIGVLYSTQPSNPLHLS